MNKERLTGPRARAAAGVMFAAELVAACGGSQPATEAPTPTTTPTEAPTPTVTIAPTESASPTPLITEAPTAGPEATPAIVVISDFINEVIANGKSEGFPKVTQNNIKNSIQTALEADPEAAKTVIDERIDLTLSQRFDSSTKLCFDKNARPAEQLGGCTGIGMRSIDGYLINQNPAFLKTLKNAINYGENTYSGEQLKELIDTLKTYNP